MSIADRVREVTETLPVEKEAEVLDFVEFLRNRSMHVSTERDAERKAQLRSERFGALRDAFSIAPDFDAPLPEDMSHDDAKRLSPPPPSADPSKKPWKRLRGTGDLLAGPGESVLKDE